MRLKSFFSLLLLFPLILGAQTFTVNNVGNCNDQTPGDGLCDDGTGACTLRAAIEEANALAGMQTIEFSVPTVFLGSMLPPLNDDIIIQGTGSDNLTIDGGGATRIFYAKNGMIVINDLTLANGLAQGGSGAAGGGGGMGAGGALLMHQGQAGMLNVEINNVVFENNQAMGGAGSSGFDNSAGGGGGLGGDGAPGDNDVGGGGGGGFYGDGADGNDGQGGGGGGFLADGMEGGIDDASGFGGDGGFGGGGAGGVNNGTGGTGGAAFFTGETSGSSTIGRDGGNGGFGGGGGGEGSNDASGGQGGFGGGGGGAYSAGSGGFGGGGGSSYGTTTDNAGSGGFGGGSGGYDNLDPGGIDGGFGAGEGDDIGNGGGGLGAGGAIFVVSGNLTMANVMFSNNSSTGGPGGDDVESDDEGEGLGGAIFIFDNSIEDAVGPDGAPDPVVTIEPGCGLTFNGNSAEDADDMAFDGSGMVNNDNDDIYGPITGMIAPNSEECLTLINIPIPTLSEWGLILLSLLLLTFGISAITQRRLAVAGGMNQSSPGLKSYVRLMSADRLKQYMGGIIAIAVILGITIFLIWGEVTVTDILGIALSAPLIANFHWLMKGEE